MRTGRRLPWLIFTVCALLVIDGMGWVTWQMLRLERREHVAQQNAVRQEAVRLALWRMDGLLSPIIAAEAGRPYFHYRPFYPAERAYSRMWEAVEPGEVLVASPLLAGPGEFLRLHFESTPNGWLTSPQAPAEDMRERAASVSLSLPDMLVVERSLVELTAILRGAPMAGEVDAGRADSFDRSTQRGVNDRLLSRAQQELQDYALEERDKPAPDELYLSMLGVEESAVESDADERSRAEFQARQLSAMNAQTLSDPDIRARKAGKRLDESAVAGVPMPAAEVGKRVVALADVASSTPVAQAVQTGRFAPVWRSNPVTGEPELLFVRAVTVQGQESTQGFWTDWPALRGALLGSIGDLLPDAELVPLAQQRSGMHNTAVSAEAAPFAGQLLAGIPAVLAAGAPGSTAIAGLTPTRTVLLVAWLAVLTAVVAVWLVLRASLALSERRGRFVSAVTHELRTPLTTFCLYSQMLADGMVPEGAKQQEYLGTLKRESERLATIVENVLAFARVGGRQVGVTAQAVDGLLEASVPSLRENAEQAGMEFEVDVEGVAQVHVAADRSSLERILGNLVDNACKYAREAEDRRIVLRVRAVGDGVEFRVRDFGPGISKRERRRVFSPFARARVNAADGSSGLGLGLALARGVARSLGGELRLGKPTGAGAEFVLWLPGVAGVPDCPDEKEGGSP